MFKITTIIVSSLLAVSAIFAQPIDVWVPDTSADTSASVILPIMVGDVTGRDVIGCDIVLTWNVAWLTADSAYFGSVVPSGWSSAYAYPPDTVKIAMAGSNPLVGSGSLLWIRFHVSSSAPPGASTTIHFTRCDFNEGSVETNPDDGLFTVIGQVTHDVGVTAILAPVGTIISGTVVTPSVTVENFGDTTETFDVKFEFGSYSDTKTVTDLASGATATVNFSNWTALPGSYNTISYSMLVGDDDLSNDTAYGSFSVIPPATHDVGVTAILAPVGTIIAGTIVTPSVTVKNFGDTTETFDVKFEFGSYSNTQTVTNLDSGATTAVNFANWTSVLGAYNTMSFTMLVSDGNLSNDTAYGSFSVIPPATHDVGVTAILAPVGVIDSGTVVTPSVTVENFGDTTETFDVKFEFGSYSDTKTVTDLASGATTTVNFSNWTALPGSYNTMSFTMLVGDDDLSNDTAYGTFSVIPPPPPAETVNVWIDDTTGDVGDTVLIPIRVSNVTNKGVIACDITLNYSGSILTALEDCVLGSVVPSGWLIEATSSFGQIVIAMAGSNPLVGAGDLVWVPFVVSGSPGDTTTIHFAECSFNEGLVPTKTDDGLFTVTGIPPYHDVGVTAIVAPVGTINEGTVVAPSVTVENFGNVTETFPVVFNISTIGSPFEVAERGRGNNPNYIDEIIYSDTQEVTLAGGGNTSVQFNSWTAVVGTYEGLSFTMLSGDQNSSNDAAYDTFEVIPIAPSETVDVWIADTSGDVGDTVLVPIMVSNVTNMSVISCDITLTYDGTNFTALEDCVLGSVVPSGWLLEATSSFGQIVIAMAGANPLAGVGDLVWVPFVVSGTPGDTTTIHFAECSFNEGLVPTKTDDGLFTKTGGTHDVGVNTIFYPTGVIPPGTIVAPRVLVENFGNQTETFNVKFEFGSYSDTRLVTDLTPGETLTVAFTTWTAVIGSYNTVSYTMLVGDQDLSNDTAYGSFIVDTITHDVGVIQILEPTGVILAGTEVTPRIVIQNFGNYDETFNCYFTIGCVYFDWKGISLPVGAVDTIAFEPWISVTGFYNEVAETDLENDMNDANDRISLWLQVTPPFSSPHGYTVETPLSYAILNPYPNPAQNNISIRFALPHAAKVKIELCDINGRIIKTLVSDTRESGYYTITTNCKDLANGAYIVRMNADKLTMIEKFIVTK